MIVKPKVRGFICTTAHPIGCQQHVQEWIDYVKKQPKVSGGPKRVLVIGASTGFGLASRIATAFGAHAQTIGVFYERPQEGRRTASAGWYNTVAFEKVAKDAGIYAKSVNGDAFSDALKSQVIQMIRQDWPEGVDLVIYSIASPRRIHPKTGVVYNSVLKPIGQSYNNKTVNVMDGVVSDISIDPASEAEINNTIAVMGGEDWQYWIEALLAEGVLATGVKTIAYDYIGPELTHDIYRQGTIGKAKEHLESTAHELDTLLQNNVRGHAYISVNKALVTQASAAIPVVPLYISMLYKIMKEKGLHEGCIEQMWRLFSDRLYSDNALQTDDKGRIRVDDWEMREDVQAEIENGWDQINSGNLTTISDIEGYREEFYKLFGFGFDGVNYEDDVEIALAIPSISEN